MSVPTRTMGGLASPTPSLNYPGERPNFPARHASSWACVVGDVHNR